MNKSLALNPSVALPANDDIGTREQLPLVRQYLRIAIRWKYVIGGAIAACLILGLVVTLLMTPKYTATIQLEISRESSRIVEVQAVQQDANIADQEFYQTQYGLLRSRSLAERVAVQLRLVDDRSFFAAFGEDDDPDLFPSGTGRLPAVGRSERQRLAGKLLLDAVDVSPVRLSRLVSVNVTTPDAALSARIANAWAANFVQTTLERRYQATAYARDFLEGRIGQLRNRLEDSERRLVRYASEQQIINLPTSGIDRQSGVASERPIAADNLAAFNSALADATTDRVQAEARMRQQGGGGGNAPEALANVAINSLREKRAALAADYEKLMVQFEPGYPTAQALRSQIADLDRSIAREERRVTGTITGTYRAALAREQALRTQVDTLKGGLLDLRRRSIQYNILQREVDTNRVLYDGLLQRYKEIGVAGGVGVNNIAIVDKAQIPERPSQPRLLVNMAIALLAGLALGAGLAYLFEQGDETIVDPGTLPETLGMPLLGVVPKQIGAIASDVLLDRKSELTDAYLVVQTNLGFSTEHGMPRSLSVTSTRPAEGKSTTSLALATLIARAGKRVVLIDGDMRSPSVHRMLGMGHDLGLSNFLVGDDRIDAMLHRVEAYDLSVMTAGPIPPNAAELLTGRRFALLLEQLLTRFDHVIVDSPPVLGLADALLIGSNVETVVYAVESQSIRSTMVRAALIRLRNGNVRVVGGVLTKFDAKKAHFAYGYDYGYGYGRDTKGADTSR